MMEETKTENSNIKYFLSSENFRLEMDDIVSKYTGKQYISSCRDYETCPNIDEDLTDENNTEIKYSENKLSNSMMDIHINTGGKFSYQTNPSVNTINKYSNKNIKHQSTNFGHKVRNANNSISYNSEIYNSNQHLHSSNFNRLNQNSNNKGKQLQQSVNEKKIYKNQILSISNRIKMLKDQEEDLNKKIKNIMTFALKDEKIKTEKNNIKSVLNQVKIEKNQRLEKNRQLIQSEKKKRTEKLEQTREETLKKKKDIFESAKNDKLILQTMNSQYNSHILNKNHYKYIKNKHHVIEERTDRFKKIAEREQQAVLKLDEKIMKENKEKEDLIKKLKELEETEERCLASLKKTLRVKDQKMGMIESSKSKYGLNSVDFDKEKSIFKEIYSSFEIDNKSSFKAISAKNPEKKNKQIKHWK